MPHVSSIKIQEKLFVELFEQLASLQTNLQKKEAVGLMGDLLTDTEKVMVTKRCAAVLMLHQGHSSYEVWNMLKLSQSTVARIKLGYEVGAYDHLVTIFDTKKIAKDRFWETLEKVLQLGMPSMGKDRWKFLDK